MFNFKIAAFSAAAALFVAGAAQANVIQNGSFEDGLTGWTLDEGGSAGDGVACVGDAFFGGAQDGNCAMQFNGGGTNPDGSIEQSFATVVGGLYEVTLFFGKYAPTPSSAAQGFAGVDLEVFDSLTSDRLRFAGISSPVAQSTLGPDNYIAFSSSFTATGLNTLLRLSDASDFGGTRFDMMLDNVSVTLLDDPNPQVVPLPASLPLMIAGMAGLVALRRKRTG